MKTFFGLILFVLVCVVKAEVPHVDVKTQEVILTNESVTKILNDPKDKKFLYELLDQM